MRRAVSKPLRVRRDRGKLEMAAKKLPREMLADLLSRAGISGTQMARNLKYSSAPGFLRYLQEKDQGDKPIPMKILQRVAPFLRGVGDPKITMEEILACGETPSMAKPMAAALEHVVDPDGLLLVKYRVEPGVYIRPGDNRVLGSSRIGPARDYPTAVQFVAQLASAVQDIGPAGTQLQCVPMNADDSGLDGKRAIYLVPLEDGAQVGEVVAVKLTSTDRGLRAVSLHTGTPVDGSPLGLVIGVFRRE